MAMSYPGSPDKDPKVQQRILAAFREAVRLFQDGHRDECLTVLHSILEVDPAFRPAQRLESALIQGQQLDLTSLLGDVAGEASSRVDALLAEARQAFAAQNYARAVELAQQVLRELPGHQEARTLLQQAQASIKAQSEVATQLARAREALAAGLVEEAKGFLRVVRQTSPHHPELAALEAQIASRTPQGFEVQFETFTPPEPSPAGGGALEEEQFERFEATPSPTEAAPEEEPKPELEAPWEAAAQASGGFAFESARQAPSFEAGGEALGSPEDRVAALLEEGQAAFDAGKYEDAVQIWSRIYLTDPHNAEAERRIEQARRRLDEVHRLAEMKFAEAYEAFEQGRHEEAKKLLEEVLALQPQHVDANDLLARLETPQAPPPLPTDLPAVEEDLFRDDFVPQRLSGEAVAPAVEAVEVEERPVARAAKPKAPAKRALPLPLPVLAGVGVAAVVLVLVALFFGSKVWHSGPTLADTMAEAEKLAQQGQLKDAINLLQSLSLEGPEANAVQQRILEYQRRLKAQAPPPPTVDTEPIRKALGEGRHLAAARLWREANKKAPGDEAVRQLGQEILGFAASLPSLAEAWERGNWETAASLAEALAGEHPEHQELVEASRVARYNRAVQLLRSFEVAEAAKLLDKLAKEKDDPELRRLFEFAKSYLSRPVDPRYKIFVANLAFRDLPR